MTEERIWEEIKDVRCIVEEVRSLLAEIAAVVWGDNTTRNNGLRSLVTGLKDKTTELEEAFNHAWNVRRPLECIGKKMLKDHLEHHKKSEEAEVTLIKERITAKTLIMVACISGIPGIFAAIVTLVKG